MKFIISFFWCSIAMSAPINVYFEGKRDHADLITKTLTQEYKIPEELIEMKRIGNCEDITGLGPLELCLKNNGDLLVVSVDHSFINDSLKIFRAP